MMQQSLKGKGPALLRPSDDDYVTYLAGLATSFVASKDHEAGLGAPGKV